MFQRVPRLPQRQTRRRQETEAGLRGDRRIKAGGVEPWVDPLEKSEHHGCHQKKCPDHFEPDRAR